MIRAVQLKPTLMDRLDPESALQFLEDFRRLQEDVALQSGKSTLISIKVPEELLAAFRRKCEAKGTRYQTLIKTLLLEWLRER